MKVTAPFVQARGSDAIVVEFLGCEPLELDQRDAIDLLNQLDHQIETRMGTASRACRAYVEVD